MRTLGAAILGVFAGLIVGFLIFSELIGRVVVGTGSDITLPWAAVIGFGPWILAVVGAVVGVLVDQRIRNHRGDRSDRR